MGKKTESILLSLGIFLSQMVFAEKIQSPPTERIQQKNFHHLYFGPEVFCFDLNTHFKGVKINGTKFFYGLNLGYEYLKSRAFYAGIDISTVWGNKTFHNSYYNYSLPKNPGGSGLTNLDIRFGYTFGSTRGLLTPFLGTGAYSFGYGKGNLHFRGGMSYLSGGIRSRYAFTPTFNLGLNIKIFGSIYRDEHFRFFELKRKTNYGLWGGEIGVPLIWHIGPAKRWDIQLEPYYLNLDVSETQNIYGTRLLFGYYF